jgi:hypothetical protein
VQFLTTGIVWRSSTDEGCTVTNPWQVEIRFIRGGAHPSSYLQWGRGAVGWKGRKVLKTGKLGRGSLNGDEMHADFDSFWNFFPRKEGRKDALKAWTALTEEQKFAALQSIPLHVRYWNLAGRSKQYMPMGGTWLRGERWTDELDMPEVEMKSDEWWKTQAGILKKAQSLGINPKPGEDYMSLKARILAHLKAAA